MSERYFMAEELVKIEGTKQQQYAELLPQIESLISYETDLIANLANVCAVLKEQFGFLWVGFYFVKDEELVLGPFQGPIACTRISYDKGVCGKSWALKQTLVVPDVEQFPGHIACSSRSKSEIVVPLIKNNEVVAVLDVDSEQLATFDQTDEHFLTKLCACISEKF